MTRGALARLLREVRGRELTVHLSERTEERLREYMDRYNASSACEPDDAFGDSDEDLAVALIAAADRGLDIDEREHLRRSLDPASQRGRT